MKIKPTGLPFVEYAQIFSAPVQMEDGAHKSGRFVISYVSEGKYELTPEGKKVKKTIYDVYCTCTEKDTHFPFEIFHEHHTVCFTLSYAEGDGAEAINLPSVLEYSGPCEVHKLIDEIIRAYSHYPERKYNLGGLVLQLIDEVDRQTKLKEEKKNNRSSFYEYKAIKYIYDNVDKPITQKDIARYLGITPEYFSAVFKSARGMPPMQFVNRVKLSSIRMLMAKENVKLYEAAQRYGYSDANYVSKLFKKYYGINITSSLSKK